MNNIFESHSDLIIPFTYSNEKGKRVPLVTAWTSPLYKGDYNLDYLAESNTTLAIRSDAIQAIDVDITDRNLSTFVLKYFALLLKDAFYYRIGQRPKFLIPMYIEGIDTKQRYYNGKIELFAGHKYNWSYGGKHHTKDMDYEWFNSEDHEKIDYRSICDLPSLSFDTISFHLKLIEGLLHKISDEIEYDTWFKVGASLHHHYDTIDSAFGLALFDLFSSHCGEYKGWDDVKKQWGYYDSDTVAVPITIKQLIGITEEEDQYTKTLQKLISNYVVISTSSKIVPKDNPNLFSWTKEDFKTHYRAITTDYMDEKGKKKVLRVYDAFLNDKRVPTYVNLEWKPVSDRELPIVDDQYNLNTFNCFKKEHNKLPKNDQDSLYVSSIITNHIRNMVDTDKEADLLLDFFAYMIQKPEIRATVHMVHFAVGVFGLGRGSITRLISKILLDENCNISLSTNDIFGNFNDSMAEKIFLSIGEFNFNGRDKKDKYTKLKDLMTPSSDYLSVNKKYAHPYKSWNCGHWFLHTNDADALPLNADERRFNIIKYTGSHIKNDKDTATYEGEEYNLNTMINTVIPSSKKLLAAAYYFFENRKIETYDPARSVTKETVREVSQSAKSVKEIEFDEYVEDLGVKGIINKLLPPAEKNNYIRMAKNRGWCNVSIRVGDETYRCWLDRNADNELVKQYILSLENLPLPI